MHSVEDATGNVPQIVETPAPAQPTAPAVVAVIVTHDPGPWFDEALAAVRDQDYPNLLVLVIDAASATDPTPRVAETMPSAYVRRIEANRGFGAAANEVREVVDGAAFFCFLHDDAAPAPDAVRTLVSEAMRSNAGIVGPKLVQWDDPRRLLEVGVDVDKFGERIGRVEPGELDQEQHDGVRDVFIVPGACTLVRADLFEAVGGFDEGIDLLNDDLDLCWRAHLAGARVLVAPDAVVRHVEALGDRSDVGERRVRLMRHRIRTMLSCYSPLYRLRIVPQAVVVAVLEVLYTFVVGRREHSADIRSAWRWNRQRRGEIAARRKAIEGFRQVRDVEIRRLQRRGSARLIAFSRGQIGSGPDRSQQAAEGVQRIATGLSDTRTQVFAAVVAVTLAVVGVGSRHLFLTDVPAVGSFAPFDVGAVDLLRQAVSGWRDVGLGADAPAPTSFLLTGLLGLVTLGSMDVLRGLLIFGCLGAGFVGITRLLRPFGSRLAQAVGLAAYASASLAYNAFAGADWPALVAYGALPWIVLVLARISGLEPYDALDVPFGGAAVRLGVLLAVVGAFAPAVALAVVVTLVAFAVATFLVSATAGTGRAIGAGIVALGVAVVLNVPWALEFVLTGARWEQVVGQRGGADPVPVTELLIFATGPVGGSPLAYGLLVAAALAVLIGRSWRLDWALRGWVLFAVGIGVAYVGEQGLGPALPSAGVLLAPALVGLALAAGLGVVAFEEDLRAYGFGWRQAAAAVSLAALVLGVMPTLLDASNGRWRMPSGGLETTFGATFADQDAFRVLWIGDPAVLPGDPWQIEGDLAFSTSTDGLPSFTDHWSGAPTGATELLLDAVELARTGQTQRLGRILAPMGVRYIVLPSQSAPSPLGGLRRPIDAELVAALDNQLDLRTQAVNPAYRVYVNEVAMATRSSVPAGAGDGTIVDVDRATVEAAAAALPEVVDERHYTGEVAAGTRVLHSIGSSAGWELVVDGQAQPRTKLYGWASGYDVAVAGEASLEYRTPGLQYALLALQLVFWAVALRIGLRRWRSPVADTPAPPESPVEPARPSILSVTVPATVPTRDDAAVAVADGPRWGGDDDGPVGTDEPVGTGETDVATPDAVDDTDDVVDDTDTDDEVDDTDDAADDDADTDDEVEDDDEHDRAGDDEEDDR